MQLTGTYHRRPREEWEPQPEWFGTVDLALGGLTGDDFPSGSRLAVWCQAGLAPGPDTNARVVGQFTGLVELEPIDVEPLGSTTATWLLTGLRSRRPIVHANDGPEAAYVIRPDGSTRPVHVVPVTTSHARGDAPPSAGLTNAGARPHRSLVADDRRPAVVPLPRNVDVANAPSGRRRLVCSAPQAEPVIALARRLGVDAFAAGAVDGDAVLVDVRIDGALGAGRSTVECRDERCTVVAADDTAARHALITLAQLADAGQLGDVTIDDEPAMAFRGVHLDLARRWYEPDVVGRLIDVVAWRKLTHVHLHLTDDEAWRFPVPEFPALAAVGGTRGHGLPIPPVCGSGAEPYGRAYTAQEIADWVTRADTLGIVLVPEVDVPGHCFAALAAVPELRDPDDTSHAVSVQGYPDNVLVPGHPATEPFLRAVFGALVTLFPSSPVVHIGGDEVPHGAWMGSPIARAAAEARGLTTTAAIEAHFHRDLAAMIRTEFGREVAAWEEVGLGGVEPGAYAIAWRSAESGQRLAAAGHRVVMAPGQAYYLDMAFDRDFDAPGATWAGNVPLETTCAFDPRIDGIDELPGELLGVQACIWSEHVSSLDVLDRLTFPRLDAIAERGWRGDVAGGAASLARRAADLPRFTS